MGVFQVFTTLFYNQKAYKYVSFFIARSRTGSGLKHLALSKNNGSLTTGITGHENSVGGSGPI
jgi:hypothetical protein